METLRWRGMAPVDGGFGWRDGGIVCRRQECANGCGDDQQNELGHVRGLQEEKERRKRPRSSYTGEN